MKTSGINELRALVAEALTQEDAAKLTEAIVRATELAEEEAKPVTRDYLDAKLAELRSELVDKMRTQQMWTIGTFILLLASVVVQHYWR